jgi:hypothetical protein
LFKDELSHTELSVVLERQKQLRGEEYSDDGFHEVSQSSRSKMAQETSEPVNATRGAMLNRLLFCVLLDTEESDFFYMTEPMFEFVRGMKVLPNELKIILESEFVGLRI